MTINATNRSVSLKVRGNGSFTESITAVLAGSPLVAIWGGELADGASLTGAAYPMQYSSHRGYSSGRSLRVQVSAGKATTSCTGSHFYASRFLLPQAIPQGYNIWYKASFFIPENFSMGSCFDSSASNTASAAGKFADAPGYTKWMVFSAFVDTTSASLASGRLYLMPKNSIEASAPRAGFRITHEPSGNLDTSTPTIPRGRWHSLQFHIYVHSTAGFSRAWLDKEFIGENVANTITSTTGVIREWGIGDYWNGVRWESGEASETHSFYIGDIIIATDYPGYGQPNGLDSGGRRYIDPEATKADL